MAYELDLKQCLDKTSLNSLRMAVAGPLGLTHICNPWSDKTAKTARGSSDIARANDDFESRSMDEITKIINEGNLEAPYPSLPKEKLSAEGFAMLDYEG